MRLYVNELSLNKQLQDLEEFPAVIERMMLMLRVTKQYGRILYCHRKLANSRITQLHNFQQGIDRLSRDKQRAVMQWLTNQGPFWEDDRAHIPDDWLECKREIVTETSLGEAAKRNLDGEDSRLVSFTTSNWEYSPIRVDLKSQDEAPESVDVLNYWEVDKLTPALISAPTIISSWVELKQNCIDRCPNLTFSADCFHSLERQPFGSCPADRILALLDTLEKLKCCQDSQGHQSVEANRLKANHFSGSKAWFTDSSQTEKIEFENELTFKHPTFEQEDLFCTWHGKVKTPQYRIHFSDPFQVGKPLYVVYIDPKITKR